MKCGTTTIVNQLPRKSRRQRFLLLFVHVVFWTLQYSKEFQDTPNSVLMSNLENTWGTKCLLGDLSHVYYTQGSCLNLCIISLALNRREC